MPSTQRVARPLEMWPHRNGCGSGNGARSNKLWAITAINAAVSVIRILFWQTFLDTSEPSRSCLLSMCLGAVFRPHD